KPSSKPTARPPATPAPDGTADTPGRMRILDPVQAQVRDHRGEALILRGAPGSGKSEAAAHRLASLARETGGPHHVLTLTASPATAAWLRRRTEELIPPPYEEWWIGTWPELCERLLREHATAAGL